MKQILLVFISAIAISICNAQTSYYKGEWTTINKHDLFTGLFKIDVSKDGSAKAEFIWTLLATDSTRQDLVDLLKGKKGKSGIEFTEGTYSSATNDFYLEGKSLEDPNVILGEDKYHLKLSADKNVIYGSTETMGSNEGLFYAIKMTKNAGEKEYKKMKDRINK